MLTPVITTYGWVPPFARGLARDLRARWACEEEGIPYKVRLIDWVHSKTPEHRQRQPFGQIPTYSDGEVEIFETGAIVLRIAELGSNLLPRHPARRMQAIQWMVTALNSIEPWIFPVAAERAAAARAAADGDRRGDGMSGGHASLGDLRRRLGELDAVLSGKTWLDGDIFTLGDLMMISVLANLRDTGELSSLRNLASYVTRGESRPAYVRALSDQLASYEAADRANAEA